jgi:hypothetical protein
MTYGGRTPRGQHAEEGGTISSGLGQRPTVPVGRNGSGTIRLTSGGFAAPESPREEAHPATHVTSSEPPTRLRVTAGGLLLWGGTVSIGLSTVVLLAVLSRHLHHEGFAGLSTLFGLFFVASLIPSGFPLRAAALAVDGAKQMRMTVRHTLLLALSGAAISPLVAYLLHLPLLAVLFVAAQIVVAIPLAIKRGSLIAAQRFDAMGANQFLESGFRIALGALAGILWGLPGVSAGIAAATGVALIFVPREEPRYVRTMRQMTSLLHTWLALLFLGLFVQLDILIAPSVMNHPTATRYDLAAVPSKGVYLVLVAISTLIFPHVRIHAKRLTVVVAAAGTFGVGLVTTALLVALRGPIAAILGQNKASLPLMVVLGVSMSIAGATGIVLNGGIALGVARPWPPLLFGMAALLGCLFVHPSAMTFGLVGLLAEAAVLLATSWVCLRHHSERGGTVVGRCGRGVLRFGRWSLGNLAYLIR